MSPTIGFVQAGQRIIGEGEIVNKDVHRILTALKSATEEKTGEQSKSILILLGEFFLIATLLGAFYTYLLFFRKKEATNREHITFMVLIITIFVILTAISVKYTLFKLLYDSVYHSHYSHSHIYRLTHSPKRVLVTILLSSLMVPLPLEFYNITSANYNDLYIQPERTDRTLTTNSQFIYYTILVYFSLRIICIITRW